MQQDRAAAAAISPIPDEATAALARSRLQTSHGINALAALGPALSKTAALERMAPSEVLRIYVVRDLVLKYRKWEHQQQGVVPSLSMRQLSKWRDRTLADCAGLARVLG